MTDSTFKVDEAGGSVCDGESEDDSSVGSDDGEIGVEVVEPTTPSRRKSVSACEVGALLIQYL